MSPFEFVKSINKGDCDLSDRVSEGYVPYIVNTSLSYFPDTLILANQMNRFHFLPNDVQYKYFINTVRPRNRYSPWNKKDEKREKRVNAVCEIYGCNRSVARTYMTLIPEEALEKIEKDYNKMTENRQ